MLGDNTLSKMMPWLDRNRMWALPFCHAVFFGLVKNFCDLLFPLAGAKKPKVHPPQTRLPRAMMTMPSEKKLSKAARDRVYERCRKLVSHCRVRVVIFVFFFIKQIWVKCAQRPHFGGSYV